MPDPLPSQSENKGLRLAASAQFDAECGLRGEAGAALSNHVLGLITDAEDRQRRLTAKAAMQRRKTVEALLANLIAAALNRFDRTRYVSVPFKRSSYTGNGLSCDAMVLARDALRDANLVEVIDGFRDEYYLGFIPAGRVTRLRATDALRELFACFAVTAGSVKRRRVKLIYLKPNSPNSPPEPIAVTASRAVLERVNEMLDRADIELPDDAWERVRDRAKKSHAKIGDRLALPSIGDPTAKALYRVFTRDWARGGRLYGAWWLNVPSAERRFITIDGEATVEIDFGNVHPALLYWARGKPLGIDPYHLPPFSRALCKETFQRLINGSAAKGGADLKKPKEHAPPEGVPFSHFLDEYKAHLHGVADCFGKDVGLILQGADSSLALAILDEMTSQGIATLPIHDSFRVQARHEDTLRQVMIATYRRLFGLEAKLKTTEAAQPGGPAAPLLEPVSVVHA